jgi:hypothetical protein
MKHHVDYGDLCTDSLQAIPLYPGQLVVQQNGRLAEVPIQSVAGKQRKVTTDDPLVKMARAVGTCFGDPC